MKLTIELLKGDEQRLTAEAAAVQGALAYNKQLQTFLAKESHDGEAGGPDVPGDGPNGGEAVEQPINRGVAAPV